MLTKGQDLQPYHHVFEGDLYDTRAHGWSRAMPLRHNYRFHHSEINTVADFKATLRAGAYTTLGSYPLYFVTSDGGALSFSAARDESHLIMQAIAESAKDGWRVIACDVNYEDETLVCDHTGDPIESAYA